MMVGGVKGPVPDLRGNEAPEPWQMPGSISATFPGKSGLSLLAGHPNVKVVHGGYEAWKSLHPGPIECLRTRGG